MFDCDLFMEFHAMQILKGLKKSGVRLMRHDIIIFQIYIQFFRNNGRKR